MGKKRIIILTVFIMAVVISATLGYLAAYAIGLLKMYESHAMTYCDLLFLESRALIRNIDSSGVNGLIDAVEQNGDFWATIAGAWQPRNRTDDDKKKISQALEQWDTAKRKLEELRSSYEAHEDPNRVDNK
jgi:hypothetical protein